MLHSFLLISTDSNLSNKSVTQIIAPGCNKERIHTKEKPYSCQIYRNIKEHIQGKTLRNIISAVKLSISQGI